MKCQPRSGAEYVGRNQPLFAFLGLVAAAFGLHWAVRASLPLPFCLLRKVTGIPCPACGCSRSLLAWADLDPLSAFRFNPLFFIASLGIATWAGAWLVGKFSGRVRLQRMELFLQQGGVRRVLAILIFLNWLYLCLRLPK